jgi:flagellar basal body rod protein FlgB
MTSILNYLAQGMWLSRQAEDVVINNLANYETPGFQPEELSFQQALGQAWQQGLPASTVQGTLVKQGGVVRPDGSGVSMTQQMASLMQWEMVYATASTGYHDEATEIRAAAEGQAM